MVAKTSHLPVGQSVKGPTGKHEVFRQSLGHPRTILTQGCPGMQGPDGKGPVLYLTSHPKRLDLNIINVQALGVDLF